MFRVPRRIRGMRQELGSIFLRGKPEVEVAVVIDTPCLEAGAQGRIQRFGIEHLGVGSDAQWALGRGLLGGA